MSLKDILKEKDNLILTQNLDSLHSYDIAEHFLDLDKEEKETLINNISKEKFAEILTYLDDLDAAEVLIDLDDSSIKEIIDNLDLDDAVDIILEMDSKEQEEIISLFDEEEKEKVESLLKYEEFETGAHMSSSFVSVNINDEIKIATKKLIKEAPEAESIKTIFVIDEKHKYQGTIALKKLLTTKSPAYVKDILEHTKAANDKQDIEDTVNEIRNFGYFEMPVINNDGTLLGMITVDDALDIYHEEQVENYEKLALLPDQSIEETFTKTAFHRLPWLLILLVLTVPIALVTSGFEELLTHMVILMVFQPLILDSAGNVATQTLAVMLKLIADNKKTIKKNTKREILSGMINGFFIGLIAAILAFFMAKINTSLVDNAASELEMAMIIGLSLWLVIILAPVIAIIIPLLLKKIKIDPAVASGPLITTIVDVLALLIYLGLASLMLGGKL
ncbi:magnesium transporter [Acholeplasma sp. OttesenSCG-928-E16]|nr:magnesium transporter [Acholeplasma sp. OttesenSCG-928-E16]